MSDGPIPLRVVQNPDNRPFAPASEPVPGHDISERGSSSSDPAVTISLFEEVNGMPYAAHRFELELYWGDPMFKEMRIQIQDVENYVRRKMIELELEDTPAAYQEILDSIMDMIGSYENEKPESQFRRLASAVQAINRMESAMIEPVLNADNLLPHEYENIHHAEKSTSG